MIFPDLMSGMKEKGQGQLDILENDLTQVIPYLESCSQVLFECK